MAKKKKRIMLHHTLNICEPELLAAMMAAAKRRWPEMSLARTGTAVIREWTKNQK